jgi:hypothetical protein
MTRKTTKGSKAPPRKSKRLSLSKKTLKDLNVPATGPQGGMGIKVPLSHCTTCPASCRRRP